MSTARTDPSPRNDGDGDVTGRGGAAGTGRDNSSAEPMRFVIPSDLERGREVQETILRACRAAGFDEDAFFAVKLALDEAVTNAIKHGNKLDPSKKVVVVAAVTPQRAEIEVSDQGPGFERSNVPDPTAEENLDKCSGRGLLLIEAYMSKVTWSEDGRTIRMLKHNTAEPPRVPYDEDGD